MTETTENCPTTQTTTTISRGISRVLIPSTTQLSSSEFDRPRIVEAGTNRIAIAGLPYVSMQNIHNTAIMTICHDLQHLYRDGDYVGHTGISEKYEAKEQLCNNKIRIAFSYSASYNNGLFSITLVPNNVDTPVKLYPTDPLVALRNHVKPKYLRKYGDDVYIAAPMSKREILVYTNLFSLHCEHEIYKHIKRVFAETRAKSNPGKLIIPDYYSQKNLQKTYLGKKISEY